MARGTPIVAGPTPPRPGAARIVAAALVLGVAILPEPGRYAAELRLRRATGTLMDVLRDGSLPAERRTRALERVIDDANASAGPLAGDPRPVIAAGSAELALGRTDRALERYRAALALGERAEIDLNVGRAFAVRDERPQAFAAFVRTAWLSPSLVPAMPVAAQSLARAEVARLERLLAEGRLAEPPPLPAFDAAPARPADPGA